MSIYVVDVEADGPCPGLFSMVQIGIVKVDSTLDTTFVRTLKPVTDQYKPEALQAIGLTRDETMTYEDPLQVMNDLLSFINATNEGKATFLSDNNGFDWQFVNYYCHRYLGENPFGFSSRRIGDFYAGLKGDWRAGSKWKHLKITKHTHDALDDAKGNAEAMLAIAKLHSIKL